MNRTLQLVLTVSLVLLMAGCATLRSGSHQKDLECPSDLASYCGGWTVYNTAIPDSINHIATSDQLVIGMKSNGTDPLAIFPRPNLLGRWGQSQIPLREIESGGTHQCMVGRVMLGNHGRTPPHTWHAITLRIETESNGEIGEEDELKICLNVQDNGGWPTACAPLNCEYGAGDPRNHGGRAHAND